MAKPEPFEEHAVAQLRDRIAFHILVDEQVISALAGAAAALREANDPRVRDVENAIRTYRIGIVKQRAVLGAHGIDV